MTFEAEEPSPDFSPPGGGLRRKRSPLQRVVFRFVLVYLVLYVFPFPYNTLQSMIDGVQEIVTGEPPDEAKPSFLTKHFLKPYEEVMDQLVLWTGKKAFKVDIAYRPLGSGDTTWNYVQIFDYVVIAAAAALIWSLSAWGWKRLKLPTLDAQPQLHAWLRVYIRFFLAQTMLVYGSFKVIKLQFLFPNPETLLHTYGESSPMHLLWTFMGASDGYTWFTGAGEVLAGMLLCTRRTTLLGAILSVAVMTHVVALNFCYDVPVKLFSLHLLFFSFFLMVPDLPWLTKAFVLGQPVASPGYSPLVRAMVGLDSLRRSNARCARLLGFAVLRRPREEQALWASGQRAAAVWIMGG